MRALDARSLADPVGRVAVRVLTYELCSAGGERIRVESHEVVRAAQALADAEGLRVHAYELSDEASERCIHVATPRVRAVDRAVRSSWSLALGAVAAFLLALGWGGQRFLGAPLFAPFVLLVGGAIAAGVLYMDLSEIDSTFGPSLRPRQFPVERKPLSVRARIAVVLLAAIAGVAFLSLQTAQRAHRQSCWTINSTSTTSIWECAPGSSMPVSESCEYKNDSSSGASIYACDYAVPRSLWMRPPV